VFNDANGNGSQDRREDGLAGRVVQLVDSAGSVIAHTRTNFFGYYSFHNLSADIEPGSTYQIQQVLPAGATQTTPNPEPIAFTRGQTLSHVDFGIAGKGPKFSFGGMLSGLFRFLHRDDPGTFGGIDADNIVSLVTALDPTLRRRR
jgi:hypothetical protein